MPNIPLIIAMALAYLIGSIPFGFLIGKAHRIDIRQLGSKNIGATNTGRLLGPKWGLICFALDVLKGTVPVLLTGLWFGWARWINQNELSQSELWAWLGVAVMPMVGHIFPVWLKFKGGKGVATGLGIVFGVWPYLTLPGIAALLTWLLYASCLRYVSLASVVAAALLPIWFLVAAVSWGWPLQTFWPLVVVVGAMALLVIWRHRTNMVRLFTGGETKL